MFEQMSRIYRLLIILVFALPRIANAADSTDWIRVQIDSFSTIRFPLIPEVLGTNDDRMLACADSTGYFAAVVSVLPDKFIADTSQGAITEMYKGLVIRATQLNDGVLMNERAINFHGKPAYEFAYSVTSDSVSQGRLRRFILLGNRLYSMEIWYSPSQAPNLQELRSKFFDSFEWKTAQSNIDASFLTVIKQSLIVLIAGFAGIIILVWLIVRRSRRKIPKNKRKLV